MSTQIPAAQKVTLLHHPEGAVRPSDFAIEDQAMPAVGEGADVYFDNVGGPLLASLIPFMARGSLVLICGLMAQYQGDEATAGDNLPEVLRAVMLKGVRIQGFTQVGQDALRPAFEEELSELVATGRMQVAVQVEEGIERLPHALSGLFDKSVPGKVVVRVGSLPESGTTASPQVQEKK